MRKRAGLEYADIGVGTAVLCIHGSMFAGAFAPLTREAALAERYRLIRYHRRGFAGSDGFTGPFSIEDQARDARALLDDLGVERAHIVGHSYGGVIALQVALDAAELVQSVVLIEPAIYGMNPDWRAGHLAAFDQLAELHRAGETSRAGRAFMRGAEGPDWKEGVEAAMPGGVEQVERDAATFFDIELPALERWAFDVTAAKRIRHAVLYVTGEIPQTGAALREFFCSHVPQTECVMIPGANHSLHHRESRVVAAEIARFLDRQP
jgi:3-oxoadipate enol-lactonase